MMLVLLVLSFYGIGASELISTIILYQFARGSKSELGPLLWNKYMFFMKWNKLVTLGIFFKHTPLKKHSTSGPRTPVGHLDPPCGAMAKR